MRSHVAQRRILVLRFADPREANRAENEHPFVWANAGDVKLNNPPPQVMPNRAVADRARADVHRPPSDEIGMRIKPLISLLEPLAPINIAVADRMVNVLPRPID